MSLLLMTPVLFAQNNKEESQRHLDAGQSLFDSGKFDAAALEFEESVRLNPNPEGLLKLAGALRAQSRYNEAFVALDRFDLEFGETADNKMKKQATSLREEINIVAARISISVQLDNADVYLGDWLVGKSPQNAPLLVDPGSYVLRAVAEGRVSKEEKVTVLSGQKISVVLLFEAPVATLPSAPAAPSGQNSTTGNQSGAGSQMPTTIKLDISDIVKRNYRIAGWSQAVAALACAGFSLGAFIKYNGAYNDELDAYNSALDSGNMLEATQIYNGSLEDAVDDYNSNKGMWITFAAFAGVFAASSTVFLILGYHDKKESNEDQKIDMELTPTGVLVSY